ncbi:MAG TPA: TrkH family potassium uptake protein [Deltaproteobacteria bacterium]|nr:TrkH family potassium uptake protein [Deltaproteobacteria bacterium]
MDRVRYRVVFKYLGGVLMVMAAAYGTTSLAALFAGESSALFYAGCGVLFAVLGRRLYSSVPEREVTALDAAATASLSFLLASVAGAPPFVFLSSMPVLDAWFESMSGFTTTGFTLLDVETAPASILFHRALSQWIGGMGFVAVTVSLLLVSGRPALMLLKDEVKEGEKIFPRIATHVQTVVFTYLAVTAVSTALLLACGAGLFNALCYTMAGVSTGGFAVHAGGAGELGDGAAAALTLIMCLGAVNFILYGRAWAAGRGGRAPAAAVLLAVASDRQVLLLVGLALACAALIAAGSGAGFWESLFITFSAQTTTGYQRMEPAAFGPLGVTVLTAAMFVGGSMGSTSGGIKLVRLGWIVRSIAERLRYEQYPAEVVMPGKQERAARQTASVFHVTALYAFFIVISAVVFVAAGFEPSAAFFEVTSAAGTVGLSSGIVSPQLPPALKGVLIFLMWAGRLEFLPVLVWLASLAPRR